MFEIGNRKFTYTAKMTETDYGPEQVVKVYENGELVKTYSEAASVKTIIEWFKELVEDGEI